jgi:hypothetical protein
MLGDLGKPFADLLGCDYMRITFTGILNDDFIVTTSVMRFVPIFRRRERSPDITTARLQASGTL